MKKRRRYYYITLLDEKELKKLRGKRYVKNAKHTLLDNKFRIDPGITIVFDVYGIPIDKYCPSMDIIRDRMKDILYPKFHQGKMTNRDRYILDLVSRMPHDEF